VIVDSLSTPEGGWKIEYEDPVPEVEDPDAPGIFPPGGCYLRKFDPSGTPCFYWERVDKEWDLAVAFGKRLVVNFDVPPDLSVSGRDWDTAKDFLQLHEVVRTITDRLLVRYGRKCLDFYWSVFNEPDLGKLFWHSTWEELQRCYDYVTDAILKAFEDRGYDSHEVFIGGLELAAVTGTDLRDRQFLEHCSPNSKSTDCVPLNAAFADKRLDGKRSKRVETLCGESGGRGAPCDFVSIHCYESSEMMAAKLKQAKHDALEVDHQYYDKLWICSHESCPEWRPSEGDPAWYDSYRGNGYFSSWASDVIRRQLTTAKQDPRYAYGESILTVWPWPNPNLIGLNGCTSILAVDLDGDGLPESRTTVRMQIFNLLELFHSMSDDFYPFLEYKIGGNVLSGFASPTGEDVRILLYAHDAKDTQSRGNDVYSVSLKVTGLPWTKCTMRAYQLDKLHNTYFPLATRKLGYTIRNPIRKGPEVYSPREALEIETASLLRESVSQVQLQSKSDEIYATVPVLSNGVCFVVIEPEENA
jgi:hypothetical protein